MFVLLSWVENWLFVLFDEVMLFGEVFWCGYGVFFGDDGWILLYFVDIVYFILFEFSEVELLLVYEGVFEVFGSGGVFFFCLFF